MTRTTPLPETGSLVTVTITDTKGVAREFLGTLHEHTGMRVHVNENPASRYPFAHERVPLLAGEMWTRIYSATGDPFEYAHLATEGREWGLGMYDFYVSTEAENIDIRPITKAGEAWVQANLSLDNQRAQLVAQVTALDPTLGQAVEDILDKVDTDAFERGKDAEFRSNNW